MIAQSPGWNECPFADLLSAPHDRFTLVSWFRGERRTGIVRQTEDTRLGMSVAPTTSEVTPLSRTDRHVRVVLETGKQKVFASALDWPGWSRAGKRSTDAAIDELLAYRTRYNKVLRLAGIAAISDPGDHIDVVDTVEGTGVTDFGVPDAVHAAEGKSMDDDECARQLALLRASWRFFDDVASEVSPELRKGPRGGGRDRDRLLDHVVQADRSYARQVGVRTPPFDSFDAGAVRAHHDAVFAAIPGLRDGMPLTERGWPVRYTIRRMAWHVLDHAWEMQDKDLTGEEQT